MKKYVLFFILALLGTVFSCQEDEPLPSCLDCGKKVNTIKERRGTVLYDSTTASYVVMMPIPGTIDAFTAGYLCEMPQQYRIPGKQVVVNGTLFETHLRYTTFFCCVDENYCLALSSVNEQ